jgi:LPXTG-motif cell wall-anchored protein
MVTMRGDYSIMANFEERPPINWALIGGIIAAVAIVGLVILFVRRKRKAA